MKKILIYSTAYFPFVGGAEVAMKEITDRVESYEFHMVTALMDRTLPRKEKVGNVMVYRVGIGHPMADKLMLALRGHKKGLQLHKKLKFSAVWSLMASYNGFAAQTFAKKTGVPHLLTLQEGDPIEYILHKVRFVRSWFNNIFTEATALTALSTYLLNWGLDMGFKGTLKEIVPNGADVARFTKIHPADEIRAIRDSFGFAPGAFVVMTASRLVVKNAVEDVIRALPFLPEHVCFAVCGSGELLSHLEGVVEELGLEQRVNFLGNKSHEELPKIMQASDCSIRPSITEGLGCSFLESMAAGLPTIGTMVGGIPDFLEDGVTGFACEVQNPKSIADTIMRVMDLSESEKKTIQRNAMAVINDRYNWTYIVKRMNHFFKEICA